MVIIVLQMMKRRPREVRFLSKGHTDGVTQLGLRFNPFGFRVCPAQKERLWLGWEGLEGTWRSSEAEK